MTIKSKVTQRTRVRNGPKRCFSALLAGREVRSPAPFSLPLGPDRVRSHRKPLRPHARSAWVPSAAPIDRTKPAAVVLVSPATGIGYFRYPGSTAANQRAPHSAGGTGGSHANASSSHFPALLYAGSLPSSNAISPLPAKEAPGGGPVHPAMPISASGSLTKWVLRVS